MSKLLQQAVVHSVQAAKMSECDFMEWVKVVEEQQDTIWAHYTRPASPPMAAPAGLSDIDLKCLEQQPLLCSFVRSLIAEWTVRDKTIVPTTAAANQASAEKPEQDPELSTDVSDPDDADSKRESPTDTSTAAANPAPPEKPEQGPELPTNASGQENANSQRECPTDTPNTAVTSEDAEGQAAASNSPGAEVGASGCVQPEHENSDWDSDRSTSPPATTAMSKFKMPEPGTTTIGAVHVFGSATIHLTNNINYNAYLIKEFCKGRLPEQLDIAELCKSRDVFAASKEKKD